MRQDAMIPGWSPAGLLLIRTDDVAVAVGGVRGYPNGFEFTVHVRLRQQGFVWGTGPFDSLADPRTAQAPEQALRLGILYANGRRARTPSYRPRPVIDKEADGGHLILLPFGGGGSERQWDGDFWVNPMPPNGPVTFVASWLLYEVAETHAELGQLGDLRRRPARRYLVAVRTGFYNAARRAADIAGRSSCN